jgi:hypothetical protein
MFSRREQMFVVTDFRHYTSPPKHPLGDAGGAMLNFVMTEFYEVRQEESFKK